VKPTLPGADRFRDFERTTLVAPGRLDSDSGLAKNGCSSTPLSARRRRRQNLTKTDSMSFGEMHQDLIWSKRY
jgi:hypothetical protein